ncbi:MAG: cytochrome c biogenesis protein CcsA [Planctomycetaceae bacterium]|nr:cytochrome c biogenesis protein CcsA [Planctomycetaceae bacterium]
MSGVSTICFAASYAVALGLEISRLWSHSRVRAAVAVVFAAAGLLAHTAFLYYRAVSPMERGAPLSSQQDWFFVAAWVLVAVYLYLALFHRHGPFGLFLLPLALALVGTASLAASATPLEREPASRAWGAIHGFSLAMATVAVLVGFVAGLMYLGQARHLKHKIVSTRGLRLPSLEWLQRANYRAIVVSVLMLGVGILSGMVLDRINARERSLRLAWHDPVVLSTWLTFAWLLAAVVAGGFFRPVRQGRKVAYLTVVSFIFLVIMLATGVMVQSGHWGRRGAKGDGGGERARTSHVFALPASGSGRHGGGQPC